MNTYKERMSLVEKEAKALGKEVYDDSKQQKDPTENILRQEKSPKLATLEEAIRKSGLKDGMTISFHHHFRGGDKVVNMVVEKLAEMGFKNLHLAASSLSDVHKPLIEHIKNGVITKISTSAAAQSPRATSTSTWLSSALRRPTLWATHAATPVRKTPSRYAVRSATPFPTPSTPTRL